MPTTFSIVLDGALALAVMYLLAHVHELRKIRNRDQDIGSFLQAPDSISALIRRDEESGSSYLYLIDAGGSERTIAGPHNTSSVEALFLAILGHDKFQNIHTVEPLGMSE